MHLYPVSMASCRDCHQRILEGSPRVGAHVFSSSSRHAGYSINYWCLDCMCARPATRRMATLYPFELEKILPGSDTLQEEDLKRMCEKLGIATPNPALLAALAEGRNRTTRSGRKFNTWGGSGADGDGDGSGADGDGGGVDGDGGEEEGGARRKRARRS
jgi:hypothetical protein